MSEPDAICVLLFQKKNKKKTKQTKNKQTKQKTSK